MYENYIGKPNFKNAKRINSKLVGDGNEIFFNKK